jgi:hypothetical protein
MAKRPVKAPDIVTVDRIENPVSIILDSLSPTTDYDVLPPTQSQPSSTSPFDYPAWVTSTLNKKIADGWRFVAFIPLPGTSSYLPILIERDKNPAKRKKQ